MPEHLRGRSFVIVFMSHLGTPAEADALLAPLRALEPVTDTIQTIPIETLSQLHMDPDGPTPAVSDGLLLANLPAAAIEAFIRAAGPDADTQLIWAEPFHIGGEMQRPRPDSGALAAIDAEYQLAAGGGAPTPEAVPSVAQSVAALHAALGCPADVLNVASTSRDPTSFGRLRPTTGSAASRQRSIRTT